MGQVKHPIIWFTGQPGAGKTTLARAYEFECESPTILIDGDEMRALFQNQNYGKEGRLENIRTAQRIAQFLQAKGFQVLVALVAPYRELREELKAKTSVVEVYCHTSDIRGRESFFSSDYEAPTENYLSLDTGEKNIHECIQALRAFHRQVAASA